MRVRSLCIAEHCTNKAYSRQLCCRHGAKKQCSAAGCTLRARRNDVCYHHGAPKMMCIEAGCNQYAQARQRCVRHGGGRLCKSHNCTSHARLGGWCQRHQTPTTLPASPQLVTADESSWCKQELHIRSYSMDSTDDVSVFESSTEFASAVMYFLSGDDDTVEPAADHDAQFDAMVMQDVLDILVRTPEISYHEWF
ncbi:hypothetical protein DYB28_008230 [Aphanomyces astaci]|uniref:Uncharacterized protein n=1 Tax=Aphanomyces astaci TaxID=112090 RepID=A0A397EC92_APHAT|nr:hypothetical protein DYB38_010649 [Aphanomyces astaci]RHY96088.1 hypothetical protein DYB26_012074 [Aphanomyces astaci]RLO03397.1 hypothetical protein DYB28_008230 [Aphanomyces astaci]